MLNLLLKKEKKLECNYVELEFMILLQW